MTARDLSHYLSCELILEIRESEDESEFGDVICHFPVIKDEYLEAFVWEDDTLMNLILSQFHIKVLEQLLIFCANTEVVKEEETVWFWKVQNRLIILLPVRTPLIL